MFEDWRDPVPWILLLLVVGWWTLVAVALALYGGPECLHGYDETGCWGGIIRYNGVAVVALFTAVVGVMLMPYLLFDLLGVPTIPQMIARSRRRRRQLFRLLEK